jgi:hypothetical protein
VAFLKKNKRPELVKTYLKLDELYNNILTERKNFRSNGKLSINEFIFNPNCKITPFECKVSPFNKFTALKKEFDYLTEISFDETY